MNPALIAQLERLAAANIALHPNQDIPRHLLFTRDGFVALVQRTADGLGGIGNAGKLTDHGLALLVGGQWVAKGTQEPASAAEMAGLKAFSDDLQRALSGS